MNKSLTKPLIRPLGGRWARVCLTALLTTVVTVGAQAQATAHVQNPVFEKLKKLSYLS